MSFKLSQEKYHNIFLKFLPNGILSKSAILTLGLAIPGTGFAQDTANTSGQPAFSDNTGEIIVTAQRRNETLTSVPLSISAYSGDQLVSTGVREIASLQFVTPGLISLTGAGYTQMFMRGIGNTILIGADPSIATYVDDVPRVYGSLVNSFINVARVEVLKGAQGGLYGRNATGGVINIITRQPSDEFEAEARASYGTRNTFKGSFYLNVPVADGVEWNIAAQRETHDGYVDNLFDDPTPYSAAMFPSGSSIGTGQQTADFFNSAVTVPGDIGRQDFWAIGSKLRLRASDRFAVTLAADYAKKDDDTGNELFQMRPDMTRALAMGVFASFGIDAQLPADFFKAPNRKFAAYKSLQSVSSLEDYGFSATAVLNLNGVDLTSISAYRSQRTDYIDDVTGIAPSILVGDLSFKKSYFYQELRAVSTGTGPLSFLAGASYLNTNVEGVSVISYLPPVYQTPATRSKGGVVNWSIYAEAGYDLTESLNLKVSGRYIRETNQVDYISPVVARETLSADAFLPAATLSYRLPNGTIYFRYAKGFKSGGINTVDQPTLFSNSYGKLFGPEKVDSFEAGYRAALLDRKLQLTAAVFYNRYKGLQTDISGNAANPGIVSAIVNAGSAKTYGAEASVLWRATPELTLGANAGYLNAEYVDFANTDGSVLNTFDFSGQRMIFSPKWQLSFTADIDKPVSKDWRVFASGLLSYTDDVRLRISTTPGVPDPVQPGYWISNARMGLRSTDDRFEVSAFANNLFNTAYYTLANVGGHGTFYKWNDPRIVGVEARLRY